MKSQCDSLGNWDGVCCLVSLGREKLQAGESGACEKWSPLGVEVKPGYLTVRQEE